MEIILIAGNINVKIYLKNVLFYFRIKYYVKKLYLNRINQLFIMKNMLYKFMTKSVQYVD